MFDKATVLPIQPEDLDFYWPFVSSFIEGALEHTDFEISLPDIRSDIDNRQRQLWVIKDDDRYIAAVVTMVYTTNTGIIIGDITLAGGSEYDAKWSHFVDAVEPWFRAQGCCFIDIPGRRGWVRKFRERGFREAYVVMRRDLRDVKGIKEDDDDTGVNVKRVSPQLPDN